VKYGTANAINAGDYLLAKAYHSILSSPIASDKKMKHLDIFTLTYEKTVEGQALDINARGIKNFTVQKYIDMVELKTGYYLACGMVGGAITSGHSDGVIDQIWKLGKLMGPAFPSKDDKETLIEIMAKQREETTEADVKQVMEIYKKYNAIDHAQRYAEDLIKQTNSIIDGMPINNKTVFKEIASFMTQRMT
jgi:geranylgeranyl pyrophosphate synthase